MVMVRATSSQVGQQIKREFAIRLRILYFLMFIFCLGCLRVFCFVSVGPWLFSFCKELSDTTMNQTSIQTFLKSTFEVS